MNDNEDKKSFQEEEQNVSLLAEPEKSVKTKNLFYRPLGDKYGKKFEEVFKASYPNQITLMDELYKESKEDQSLNDYQRRLINMAYVAYKLAIHEKSICTPLITFVKVQKPNITKFAKSNRFARTVSDLDTIIKRSGFEGIDSLKFEQALRFLMQPYMQLKQTKNDDSSKIVPFFFTTVSRYVRNVNEFDYITIWFVCILIKHIINLFFLNPKVLTENKDIINMIQNTVKTIITIYLLEEERDKKIIKNDKKSNSKETIKQTELDPSNIEEELLPIKNTD